MNAPTPAQLDDFARRLRTLEAELESLKRQAGASEAELVATPVRTSVAAPARAPWPPLSFPELATVSRLIVEERFDEAVRALERQRRHAFDERYAGELVEILELTRRVVSASGRSGSVSARRLVYAVETNLRFLHSAPEPGVTPTLPRRGWRAEPARGRETGDPAAAETPTRTPTPTRAARPPRAPWFELPNVRPADLLGARALALAGGVVTLLGIVFFFVLAVDRGWVGPTGRVALGAIAASIVFAAGIELRRRFGETYSSLAAAGAGIAGGYATLLAAAALYDLLPDFAALLVAAAIAAVGVVTSIAWRSQIVAGLGLIGAMIVPLAVVAQGGVSALGTAFAVVVFAATALVALRTRWRGLLVAGAAGSAAQVLLLVSQPAYLGRAPWQIVVLAAAAALLLAGAGVGWQLRYGGAAIGPTTSSLSGGGAVLMAGATLRLFGTPQAEGVVLLATALCYGLAAFAFFPRRATRDLGALLAEIAFVLGAFALGDLFSGRPLVYAWAAEAASLAWLARRTGELRFQVWSAVYFVLCAGHALTYDAPPSALFVVPSSPAAAGATAAAVALAAAVFGFYARAWPEPFEPASGVLGVANPVLALFHRRQPILRSASLWLGGAFAALAASLAAVSLFASFEWSFVAVTSIWSLTGLGILATGLQRDSLELRRGGGAWLIVVSFAVVAHVGALEAAPRSWSLLVLALVLFGAGLACQLLDRRDAPSTADAAASASAVALVVGAVAAAGLLSGQPLACAWAAEAVALVWMSHRLRARHLHALAALPFGLAVVHLLAIDAPPRQLVLPVQHPAAGAATAVAIALSAFAAAALSRGWPARGVRTYGRLERPVAALVGDQRDARDVVLWWGGAVGLYALSLAILAAWPGFDWAWVALTGVWSGVALALLLRGLRVGSAQLRHGGLATLTLVTLGVVAEGASVLDATPRSAAFLVLAVSLLVAGLAYALRVGRAPLEPVTVVATLVSLGLSWDAIRTLLEAPARGLAMLALAGLYGAIGAVLLRRPGARDLSTLYWALGLLVGAVAIEELLHGTFTVVGWSVTGVVVAWLSLRVQEPRLLVGAAATVALALIHALVLEAPPTDLFSVQPQPGAGAPAVLVVAAAVAALAYCAEGQPGALRRGGKPSWWLAGTLVVYGTSLSIVQLAESVSGGGLEAGFQSGQTAVSAFWGLLGLGLLYAGLTRWRSLRLAGLALFAVSLGKIFLYDLPALSSIERALSFLAVGAVLLLGAFFYQRLNAGKRSDAGRDGGRTA